MINKTILVTIVFLSFILFQHCRTPTNEISPIGRGKDGKSDLVYFFKKGITDKEIQNFLYGKLSKPKSNGKGYESLPGYESSALIIVDGYTGYEMQFKPTATKEQKKIIESVIKNSPIIYKVFENVNSSSLTL